MPFMTGGAHFLVKRRMAKTNTVSETYFLTCVMSFFLFFETKHEPDRVTVPRTISIRCFLIEFSN